MAKDASGDGASFSTGEVSDADDGGGGTVQVESRLFFDGTVAPHGHVPAPPTRARRDG